MRGTVPIIECDYEYGCGDWIVDYYAMDAENWRDTLDGWQYDPYADPEAAYCPEHKGGNTDTD